ncbi:hypothetical protein VULLAG_LOCUS23076 [Vulpes lagopus]
MGPRGLGLLQPTQEPELRTRWQPWCLAQPAALVSPGSGASLRLQDWWPRVSNGMMAAPASLGHHEAQPEIGPQGCTGGSGFCPPACRQESCLQVVWWSLETPGAGTGRSLLSGQPAPLPPPPGAPASPLSPFSSGPDEVSRSWDRLPGYALHLPARPSRAQPPSPRSSCAGILPPDSYRGSFTGREPAQGPELARGRARLCPGAVPPLKAHPTGPEARGQERPWACGLAAGPGCSFPGPDWVPAAAPCLLSGARP